jgi:PKD repeat protein
MRTRVTFALVMSMLAIVALLFSCGGRGNMRFPTSPNMPGISPDTQSQQLETAWPTSLPVDKAQPWETVGGDGRIVSSINLQSQFVPGVERFQEAGNVSNLGEASRMASGAPGSQGVSWAIYRIPMGAEQPGTIAADVNLRLTSANSESEYYLGVGDYSVNTWHWYGPYNVSHVRFNVPAAAYTSALGNLMVAVVAYDGADFDLVGLGVNARDNADSTAPPAPPTPTLTPEAGGVLAEWVPVVAGDLAGYRVYANGREVLNYIEGGTSTFIPATGDVSVTLRSVDVSGNLSDLSSAASATSLTGNIPVVQLTASSPSGTRGNVIALSASGADSYDWDVDGDGTWDITNDTTGAAFANTTNMGIIRPALRAHAAGDGFWMGAVSLIIAGNSRPVVSASASPQSGAAPLAVTFTVTAADDDGTIAEYAWDFDGDGVYDATSATNPSPLQHVYPTEGLHNVKFRATDNLGSWDVDTIAVDVEPGPAPIEQIESGNQVFRNQVGTALQTAAAQAGVQIYSDDFAVTLLEDGSTAAVNAGIAGASNLTLDDISAGANVLFTFLRLPQGSELASGFYTVRFAQAPTGEWLVQFLDQSGAVALQKSAQVGFGDPSQMAIGFTLRITYDPFTITIDWHLSDASGSAALSLGSGGVDPTPLTPAGQMIMSAADVFRAASTNTLSRQNPSVQNKVFIASRGDTLCAFAYLQGTNALTVNDFLDGQDMMFGYFRIAPKQKAWLPANFRLARVQGDTQSAQVLWEDTSGNTVATSPAVLGSGTGLARTSWSFIISLTYVGFDNHSLGYTLTMSLADDNEQTAQADIETANQNFRAGVATAMESASALAGIDIRTDDFTAGYLTDGSLAAVSANVEGAETYTPADISVGGADMFLLFLDLPQGSAVTSGFYVVRIYEDSVPGIWWADLRDMTGVVALTVPATVGAGDPTQLTMPKSLVISYPPLDWHFDWNGAGSSGSFEIAIGNGGPNITPFTPEGLKIVRSALSAGKVVINDFNFMKRTAQQPVLMISRDDQLFGQTILTGVENLTAGQLAGGQDVFFGYFHLPQASGLPPGFYTLSYKDPNGDSIGAVRFRDSFGQTRGIAPGQVGVGSGSDSKILTGGCTGNSIWIDIHVLNWSVTATYSW